MNKIKEGYLTDFLVNNAIKFNMVLVIGPDGAQLGIMQIKSALERAKDEGLDLVCVSPNSATPVCKIMNYGKYKFDQQKKEKKSKKIHKEIETSEIQFSLTIQEHDLEIKAKTAQRLLEKGNLVRVVLRLRGREINFAEQAIEKINNFAEMCSFAKIKKSAFQEGKDIKLLLEKK